MSVFGDLTTQGLEESQDRLGGFNPFDSDAYKGTIMLAYTGLSDSKARFVEIHLDMTGRPYRERIYITNKEGQNFFLNKDDNTKKVPLPGFTVIDDICVVTTEKPLANQATENKVVNIYDPEAKKELPKDVPVLIDLIGKDVTLGILQVLKNKSEKNDSTGKYVDIAGERIENTIAKVFHYPTNLTVPEVREAAKTGTNPEANFYPKWVEANKGKVVDKRTIKDGEGAPKSGRPAGNAPQGGQQTSSLFGKK